MTQIILCLGRIGAQIIKKLSDIAVVLILGDTFDERSKSSKEEKQQPEVAASK